LNNVKTTPSNGDKTPSPSAAPIIANKGKQAGQAIAVKSTPIEPNLSKTLLIGLANKAEPQFKQLFDLWS
jgi:hypothetical protein